MRLSTRALSLIIVTIITGCISIKPRPEPLPDWVKSVPTDSTYFYGVGVGEKSSLALARKIAQMRATAEITETFKVHILSLHMDILSVIDSSDISDFPPDFPEGPIIMDHPTPTWSDLTASVSMFVDYYIEKDKDKIRVYALARASIPEFYEAFLEWVQPLVPIWYYELLTTLLKGD